MTTLKDLFSELPSAKDASNLIKGNQKKITDNISKSLKEELEKIDGRMIKFSNSLIEDIKNASSHNISILIPQHLDPYFDPYYEEHDKYSSIPRVKAPRSKEISNKLNKLFQDLISLLKSKGYDVSVNEGRKTWDSRLIIKIKD